MDLMNQLKQCRMVGTFTRTHGTQGSLILVMQDITPNEILKWESVFVEIDGLPVPFFIDTVNIKSSQSVILKLEEIDDERKANRLKDCRVYCENTSIKKQEQILQQDLRINGYKVIDKQLGSIGIAGKVSGITENRLLEVMMEDKLVLVPVHPHIILEIRDKDKTVLIDAPAGLFDL